MSRMCWGCGYDVPDNEDECPNCGDKVPSGKCPFCGEDMYPSYHHICRHCGRDDRPWMRPENWTINDADSVANHTNTVTQQQAKRTENLNTETATKKKYTKKETFVNLSFLLSIGVLIYMMVRVLMTATAPDGAALLLLVTTVTLIFVIIARLSVMAERGTVGFLLYLCMTGLLYYGSFALNESLYEAEEYRRQLYQPRQVTTPYKEETKSPASPVAVPPKTEPRTPVITHTPSQPKSQKAKDEEDYSRGYDDGRFSAAEGIWEDYDENESEAYINGYQDGQGEAREEMEEERQRQNKPSK